MSDLCCGGCIEGAPEAFKLSVGTVTNLDCSQCSDYGDAVFQLDFNGGTADSCSYIYEELSPPCGISFVYHLKITAQSNGSVLYELGMAEKHDFWTATGDSCLIDGALTLSGGGAWETECTFPTTVTIEAIPPANASALDDSDCFVVAEQSCPVVVPQLPFLGNGESSGCGCGDESECCGAGADPNGAGMDVSVGVCGSDSACALPLPTDPPIQVPGIPGSTAGPSQVNVQNGNNTVQIGTPNSGNLVPTEALTYNSKFGGSGPFGWGWSSRFDQKLTDVSDTEAKITKADGTVTRFVDKNASNEYLPLGLVVSSLTKNANGTWTETQPNGFQIHYDTGGNVSRFENSTGNRWTLSFNGSGNLSHILDPVSGRTSYSYDGSNSIRRIEDTHGRITTFTVDVNGNLTKRTTPELCVTELIYGSGYAANHLLIAHIDPEGYRTTFGYDQNGWLQTKLLATGVRYTFSYDSWSETHVTDPAGNRTTLQYNVARNLSGVLTPEGTRATYTWANSRLTSYNDGGCRTTVLYSQLGNRTHQVQAMVNPCGRTTFAYDTSDRVAAVIDANGNRTSNVWDTNDRRIAVIDALGNRASTLYNTNGQVLANIDQLGNRNTNVYDASGSLAATINPLGNRTSFTYHNGQVQTVENAIGAVSTTLRDDVNRPVVTINPLGFRNTTLYDTDGRVTGSINPLGARTTVLYGSGRQVKATINPLANRTSFAYDNRGNQVVPCEILVASAI